MFPEQDNVRHLSDQERIDWLRLIRTENIGPNIFYQLLSRFGTVSQVLEALPHLARRGGRVKPLKLYSLSAADREISTLHTLGGRLVAVCEQHYPYLLKAIKDAPPLLSVLGHSVILQDKSRVVAMVGTRRATVNGRRFAYHLAQQLGENDYSVVSGMALGIDRAVHEGALAYSTAAFLAGSVDHVYPYQNRDLYNQLKEVGLLLSEVPLGASITPGHFPRRNRLISGSSLGVVVVEATLKSGALITAQCALEQGREVFAVPGFPLEPRAQGSNKLLKQGATLVESYKDIDEALGSLSLLRLTEPATYDFLPTMSVSLSEDDLEKSHQYLQRALSVEPVTIDHLIQESNFPTALILASLAEMEIAGRIERHTGHRVSLLVRA